MGKNPFHDDLDDTFRGVRVRVHTDEHSYEGWCGRWYYNEHAVIIYDAERADGEVVGAVTLSNPETVERLPPTDPIEEVRVADIAPSPYTQRSMDDADHEGVLDVHWQTVDGALAAAGQHVGALPGWLTTLGMTVSIGAGFVGGFLVGFKRA